MGAPRTRGLAAGVLTLVLALGAAVPAAALGGAAAPTVRTLGHRDSANLRAPVHATIVISNFMFHPMRIVVAPGERIVVVNKDSVVHTLTAINGRFTTGDIPVHGRRVVVAPRKKGTYHYFCKIHQFMTGTIVVR